MARILIRGRPRHLLLLVVLAAVSAARLVQIPKRHSELVAERVK